MKLESRTYFVANLFLTRLRGQRIYFLDPACHKPTNMPRSVNAVASRKRRKKILKAAKGYFGARKNVYTVAKNAVEKAMQYSYRDRRNKKRAFRRLWIARINAGARQHGMSYSKFMHALSKNDVSLNRKVLADMAMNHPDVFKAIIDKVK